MLDDPLAEFDRQADRLKQIATGVLIAHAASFETALAALRLEIVRHARTAEPRTGNIPAVIVVKRDPFPYPDVMRMIRVNNQEGRVEMTPKGPEDFHDLESVELPTADVYVLWDVDTGRSLLGVSPADSLDVIRTKRRTMLSMQEGLFAALAVPELLTDTENFNCIQMPGSRIADDLRVPSIWMSKGSPRLGWCWFGNPHTWLATASAKTRLAIP